MAGLNFEFFNPPSKQAVFQVRLEVSVRSEQNINESCMLTMRSVFSLTVGTRVRRGFTRPESAYYFTMNTQARTMYTSVAALSHYPIQGTQCDSIRFHVDKMLISLELFNGKRCKILCTAYLRRKSHCEKPALKQRATHGKQMSWDGARSLIPRIFHSNLHYIRCCCDNERRY